MPNYDYRCSNCQHEEEVFQKMTENPLAICPACQQNSWKRGPGGGIGLHFKGSGFYHTDYTDQQKDSAETPPPAPKSSCCPCKNSSCSH